MKPYKVYLHTKSGEYPPKDKWENTIFVFGYGATWWPVEKQIWKKTLHLFVGPVPRNNCTKFQKNPAAAVGGDAI